MLLKQKYLGVVEMHKVIRTDKPSSLANNQERWTKDLLDKISEQGSYSKVENKYKVKYNTDSVNKALYDMYGDFCCYCEGRITVTGYKRIEHRKPRSKFPELCYEWDNLHTCCEVCNSNKGELWDEDNPIIDPAIDDPKEYLQFKKSFVFMKNNNLRGKTTIDFTLLNREKLEEARRRILNRAFKLILHINETGDIEKKKQLRKYFEGLIEEDNEFVTFKKYILDTYLKVD